MRYATLLVGALASSLTIHGHSLSPRQALQSTTTTTTQETIATSFRQVTDAYSSISTYFSQTRQTLVTSTSIDQCSTILTQLTTQISEAVSSISGGCDCSADGIDTQTVQTTISIWFMELQSIIQYLQSRFPRRYQTFSTTFTQISTHIEVALGSAYSSGVQIDSVVQRAIQKSNINPTLFSHMNIQTSHFTSVSQRVNSGSGVFATLKPIGARFPDRIAAVHSGLYTPIKKYPVVDKPTVPGGKYPGTGKPTVPGGIQTPYKHEPTVPEAGGIHTPNKTPYVEPPATGGIHTPYKPPAEQPVTGGHPYKPPTEQPVTGGIPTPYTPYKSPNYDQPSVPGSTNPYMIPNAGQSRTSPYYNQPADRPPTQGTPAFNEGFKQPNPHFNHGFKQPTPYTASPYPNSPPHHHGNRRL